MNYNGRAFVRFGMTASLALMLAACGDNGGTGTSGGEKFDMPATELTAEQAAAEGTWGDIVYGNPDAPVTVVEYASLTCPHCATFAKEYFPEFKTKYIDTGKVKLLYRNFIMNRVDLMASAAARCGDMEVTQKLMSVYFSRQYDWARSENPVDELASLARRVGISRTGFDQCVNNKEMHKHLMALTKTAVDDYKVNSTPSFFVNGERIEFSTFDDLEEAMTKAIGSAN